MVIVSDLPLRGEARQATAPMVRAIARVLRQKGFRAGEHQVGYQSCDDSVGGDWDEARCAQNARAYVANRAVIGVIGPYNSGCAGAMLPILSRASAGPLGMISPANTYIGLTRSGPGTEGFGPGRYYPDGIRNYVRLAPPDDTQGAAAAVVARDGGARKVVALVRRGDLYSAATGAAFVRATRRLGLTAVAVEWRERRSHAGLAGRVSGQRPDVVYIAGGSIANGRRLIEDLRGALGPDVLILAPDGWAGLAADLGPAGEGMLITASGVPPEFLPERGRALVRAAGDLEQRGRGVFFTAEAGQAAEVLMAAIAASDGTRPSVVKQLFRTRVKDGILGDFEFDAAGDMDPAFYGLYQFQGGEDVLMRLVRAPTELVRAER